MKLIFKHILKSIIKSPWQSIVILISAVMSAVIFACLPSVYSAIQAEREFAFKQKYGVSSVIVTPSADSDGRYVTYAELEGISPENADITGVLALPFICGGDAVLGAATDFYTVSRIFDFYFTEKMEIKSSELDRAVFITSKLAEEHGLSLGDELNLKLFSLEKSYFVAGISEYPFLGEYKIIAHAPSALDALSAVSPVFAVFDENNLPYTEIFIKGDAESILNSISGCDVNAQMCVGDSIYYDRIVQIKLAAVLFLSVVLGGTLLGFSLELLGRKRSRELALFRAAGASESTVFHAFCGEIFAYIVLAGAIGAPVSVFIIGKFGQLFDFAVPHFTWMSGLVMALALMLVGGISIFIYRVLSENRKKSPKNGAFSALFFLILFAIMFASAMLGTFSARVPLVIVSGLLWVMLVILGMRPMCEGIARIIDFKRAPISLSLALKNISKLAEIQNIYRILCIIVSVCTVLAVSVGYFGRRIDTASSLLQCDYIVACDAQGLKERAESVEGTERVGEAYFAEASFAGGRPLMLLDAPADFVSGEEMPVGGISLSESMADFIGASIGDMVEFEISGKKYSLTLVSYANDGTVIVPADITSLGLSPNALLISAISDNGYAERLSAEFSLLGAAVMDIDDLLEPKLHFIRLSYEMLSNYVFMLISLAAVGALNLLCVSYIRRRQQLAELHVVGMSRAALAKMLLSELIVVFLLSTALAAIGGLLLTSLFDSALRSFGYNLLSL